MVYARCCVCIWPCRRRQPLTELFQRLPHMMRKLTDRFRTSLAAVTGIETAVARDAVSCYLHGPAHARIYERGHIIFLVVFLYVRLIQVITCKLFKSSQLCRRLRLLAFVNIANDNVVDLLVHGHLNRVNLNQQRLRH